MQVIPKHGYTIYNPEDNSIVPNEGHHVQRDQYYFYWLFLIKVGDVECVIENHVEGE